jgi:hypothetical protein
MSAADKSFCPDQGVVFQTDFWLVVDFEFLSFERAGKFGLEPRSRFELGSDAALEDKMSASIPRLCAVQGKVSVANEIVRCPAISLGTLLDRY